MRATSNKGKGYLKLLYIETKKKYFFGLRPSEYYRSKHVRHLMIIVRLLTVDDLQEKARAVAMKDEGSSCLRNKMVMSSGQRFPSR